MSQVVLVPGTLALLPEYRSLEDPVAELRTACRNAVTWLVEAGQVMILADERGRRIGEHLVSEAGGSTRWPGSPRDLWESEATVLAVGNGSACRTEKAPGHFDERAAAFDAGLGRRLKDGPTGSLAAIDRDLAHELWASVDPIIQMASIPDISLVQVDYDDDPYGVQYWVVRWASQIP